MEKFKAFLRDSWEELLYKVQWPTSEELQSSTVTVFVASLIIAIIIALLDLIFKSGLDVVYSFIFS
jgi:preprotein translocase subunit SecE